MSLAASASAPEISRPIASKPRLRRRCGHTVQQLVERRCEYVGHLWLAECGRDRCLEGGVVGRRDCSAPATACDRIVCFRIASNSSPVMKVEKPMTSPSRTCTHLECVLGMHTARAPVRCRPRARREAGSLRPDHVGRCPVALGETRQDADVAALAGTGTAPVRIADSDVGTST